MLLHDRADKSRPCAYTWHSFDVLVHVDLHTIHKYMREFHRVLRSGGKAFISTANITAPGKAFFAQVFSHSRFRFESLVAQTMNSQEGGIDLYGRHTRQWADFAVSPLMCTLVDSLHGRLRVC